MNLAEHLQGKSHDQITDFLAQQRLTGHHLGELVQGLIVDGTEACLILDDSVQDKRFSQMIDLVKRPSSGKEHGVVRGIGIVTQLATSHLNRHAKPWVWGRPPTPHRQLRRCFAYRL